ncbi:MAG: DCC1-like thiol-disulfide oxidoreductase family protein [Gemmatimonadaceae bacterium]|nr:DCC1-like thiol-disulfide oxidoreductase family protein [Gemmatimonadaceae bacterium]
MTGPILFFDGACGLCSRAVVFLMRRDARGVIRYAPLGGATDATHGVSDGAITPQRSLVWREADGRVLRRSDGALAAAAALGGAWRWLAAALRLVPRGLRDAVYDAIAERRHRWFGSEACEWPTDALRARVLP